MLLSANPSMKVAGLLDSGYFSDNYPSKSGEFFRRNMISRNVMMSSTLSMNRDCLKHHEELGRTLDCVLPQTAIDYIKTPILIREVLINFKNYF